jgi:hypothetical protein
MLVREHAVARTADQRDPRSCGLGSQLEEALKIRNEEQLPVYERLGDVLLVGRANLAVNLLTRGGEGDREEARRLLRLALDEARRLKLPEAEQIEALIEQAGLGGD